MPNASTQRHRLIGAAVRLPDTVVFRDFPSETVVLNLATGKYHGLNPTAGEMLTELGESGSVVAAAATIAERHGVAPERVQDDICALCEQLHERGLIAIEHGPSD